MWGTRTGYGYSHYRAPTAGSEKRLRVAASRVPRLSEPLACYFFRFLKRPLSRTLRAARGRGGPRPSLTAAASSVVRMSGRDGETALSRTRKQRLEDLGASLPPTGNSNEPFTKAFFHQKPLWPLFTRILNRECYLKIDSLALATSR